MIMRQQRKLIKDKQAEERKKQLEAERLLRGPKVNRLPNADGFVNNI